MSSSDVPSDIPQTRDGAPNWAADTDPVGPVTPELALVDPGLTRGEIDNEVTMSSQFGDGTTLGAAEAAHAPLGIQPLAPPASPPLMTAPEAAPMAPQPAPPTLAPATPEPAPPAPVDAPAGMAIADMRDVPLGTLVFRAGLLPEERLEEALQDGMKTGKRLGEILLERNWVSEVDLGRLLAGQKGLPFVELDPVAVDPTAARLLPQEKARLHGALPIGFENGVPVVAVADPSNDLVVENVRRALNCDPVLIVAGRDALHNAINHVYGTLSPEPVATPVPAAGPEPIAQTLVEPPAAPALETASVEPATPVVEPVAPTTPHAVAPPAVEVVPLVVEPAVPVAPTAPPTVPPAVVAPEPPAAAPAQNGDGLWLGAQPVPEAQQPETLQPVPPVEPVQPTEAVQQFQTPGVPPAARPEPIPDDVGVAAHPAPEPQAEAEATWSVVLRLANDERLELGQFVDEAEAVEHARGVVAQVSSGHGWPFVSGRFIRPDAIVSVDLIELELSKWLGSSARTAALAPQASS